MQLMPQIAIALFCGFFYIQKSIVILVERESIIERYVLEHHNKKYVC